MLDAKLVQHLHRPADDAQPARLPDRERQLEADRHTVDRWECLLSRILAEPCRRQRHRCPEFGLSRSDCLCFPNLDGSLSNLITTNGQTVRQPERSAPAYWARSTAPGLDQQLRRLVAGGFQRQVFDHDNHFVVGMSVDRGLVQFTTNSELGTINANQFPFVQGVGVFIDQPSGDVAPVGLAGARRSIRASTRPIRST